MFSKYRNTEILYWFKEHPSKQGTISEPVVGSMCIGTTPPVVVFMCIHVNTRVLPVGHHDFDTSRTGSELVRFHWWRVIT